MRHLLLGRSLAPATASRPACWTGAAAPAIAVVVVWLLLLAMPPASAQHPSSRLQWQPQTMPADPRLDQPVEIEITGRAAVPALELLSQAIGVSLRVAPEDLNTVGERKLTIISKGLTLKAIMVQLPEALQEAHWDVARDGDEPVYLLHRDSDAEHTMKWLEQRDAARRAAKQRDERINRMEEAKRALAMSPEQLAELEESDPLLARSIRDPHSRDLLEILLSLPPEQAEQFRDTGQLAIPYAEAPERMRQAMNRVADWWVGRLLEWAGEHPEDAAVPEELGNWRDHLDHAAIEVGDLGVEHGWGVWLALGIPRDPDQGGWGPPVHDVALQPRYCNLDEGQQCYTRLLVATGVADEETALQMAIARDKQGFRADDAKREERRQREWTQPTDPALLQTVVIGDARFDDFAQLHAFIANATGIPIVSDYFTLSAPFLSDEVRQGIPLWRLLYLVGEDSFRNEDVYLWSKRGDCLVFHRADWPRLARSEIPESLIADCRARLAEHGEFTLDDLADIAVALESRRLAAESFPRDLQRAGIHMAGSHDRWALLLYASLTPDQKEKLATPEGLAYDDMTVAQRAAVRQRASDRPFPLASGEAAKATFVLATSAEKARDRAFEKTELQLRFPSATETALVRIKLLQPTASPAP